MTAAPAPVTATIRVHLDQQLGRVDPNIYGHFLESNFFGNVDGGVFDESLVPQGEVRPEHGLHPGVVQACRRLGVPLVRWPGGNFASGYHWEDGIGPRHRRPRRFDLAWRGEESNHFGTDEFLAWCAAVGAEPYLVHSARDVEEAARWVEYTNYGGDTAYTRARAANGHPAPYGVRYWGVGNEVYGPWQLGHRGPKRYAADAREHARFMRAVDPGLRLVAVGAPTRRERWLRALLRAGGGDLFDYVSLHLYAASTHLAGDDEYDAVVGQARYFEAEIDDYSRLVEEVASECGLERPPSLALDEWTIRHLEPAAWPAPQPGADGGVRPRERAPAGPADRGRLRVNRWSPRTLADALFYAGVFHALHRLSGRAAAPRMATAVNLVNANAPLAVRGGAVLASASYHVWDLYRNHLGPLALPTDVEGPTRTVPVRQGSQRDAAGSFVTVPGTVPDVDAIATQDAGRRRLQLAVINRRRADPVLAQLVAGDVAAALPAAARVHDLGADCDDVYATNLLSAPDRVRLRDRGDVLVDGGRYRFPPHSVTVLDFTLGS